MSADQFSVLYSILKIIGALLLVVLNGLFVAAEFAFVKVRPTRIAQLAAEGNSRAITAQGCVEHIDAYLSVSQLGITLASLGLGWLGEPAVATLITPLLYNWDITNPSLVHSISFIISFGLITFLHVVFGELAPKSLAIQKAESLTLWLAGTMRFFYYIFYPAVAVLNGTANKLILLLGLQPASDTEITHSEEELRMLISESYRGGQINKSEQELLQNVFRFEKRVAEEIMVPRPEVCFLDTNNSWEENLILARKSGHTRFPLVAGSPDQIIGLIHIKDIFYVPEHTGNISDLKRSILYIPEGMPLDRLLQELQKSRIHMAVVIDEYGGTAGIVTMENVLEELVGEIQDEFDHEEPEVRTENDFFMVSGRMFIDDAAERFDLTLDEDDEQYNTLAGFVLGKLGKRPQEGDIIETGTVIMEVAKMKGLRIDKIRITPREEHQTGPEHQR